MAAIGNNTLYKITYLYGGYLGMDILETENARRTRNAIGIYS